MPSRYRALLIGNGVYPEDPHNLPPLEGPVNDLGLLRAALTDSTYGLFSQDDVTVRPERTSYELLIAMDQFFGEAERDDTLLFYYSGHGHLDLQNSLFLCARDTRIERVRATSIVSQRLSEFIEASAVTRVVLILDCCHSGAFKGNDIAAPLASVGRYVLTSCRSRELANDAVIANRASPFTHHLVQGLLGAAPNQAQADHLTIEELHRYIRDSLASEGRQRPQFISRGDGHLAIARRPTATAPAPASASDEPVILPQGPAVLAPRELPPASEIFVNRVRHIERLIGIFDVSAVGLHPAVAVVSGLGGIGKTTLALHVAHRVKDHFPDGQLFADLGGSAAQPVPPMVIQEEFLRALGVKEAPEGEQERARHYRSAFAQRRCLIVLDDAASEAQVRPLIPGGPGCGVLITSRSTFRLLDASAKFSLETLDVADGARLIGQIVGEASASEKAEEVRRLANAVGGFPLALRIIAAQLAGHPGWRFTSLAQRVDDERHRLKGLRMGDIEARAGFAFSYRSLSADGQRLFRLLGLADLKEFAVWVPAALLDISPAEADDIADELVSANLLEPRSDAPRYRLHDLLRLFARERAEEEIEAAEKSAVLERLYAAAFMLADLSDSWFSSGNSAIWDRPTDWPMSVPKEDLAATAEPGPQWFDGERVNLIATAEQASEQGHLAWTWRIASAMWQYLEYSCRWSDWRMVFELARDTARRAGDALAESSSLRLLGRLNRSTLDEAEEQLLEALHRIDGLDEPFARAMTLKDLAMVARLRNQHARSVDLLQEAIAGYRSLGQEFWVAAAQREVGIEYRNLGEWDAAREAFDDSIAVFARTGEESQEAGSWLYLGVVERLQGNWSAAESCLSRAGAVFDRIGRREASLDVSCELGALQRAQGQFDAAVVTFERCIRQWQELNHPGSAARTMHELAVTQIRRGDPAAAAATAATALEIFVSMDDRISAARVLVTAAQAELLGGAADSALAKVDSALVTLRELGDPLWVVRALRVRADALEARADMVGATAVAAEADRLASELTIVEDTGI